MNEPMTDELEVRLRHGLRAVAHATAVPPRPELVVAASRGRGLRTLAVAAVLVAILGAIALGQVAGAWRQLQPSGPQPRGEAPFPAVQRLVSLNDPRLAKSELEGIFGALELDVRVQLVPVPPERANRLLGVEGGIEVEDEDEQCRSRVMPGCRIRVTAPEGFAGHGVLRIGLNPDGEVEMILADAFDPGQPLHCHDELLGATLVIAQQRAAQLGLQSAAEYQGLRLGEGADGTVHVVGAHTVTGGLVVFDVQIDPYRPPASRRQAVREGC